MQEKSRPTNEITEIGRNEQDAVFITDDGDIRRVPTESSWKGLIPKPEED